MRKRLHTIWLVIFLLSNWIVSIAGAAELKIEKTLTETDGLASNTVLTIFEDSRGNMWFGTTDGVTRYDGESFQTFTTEDGLADNTIGLIFEDRHGMLWFADGMLSSLLERGESMDRSWMETPLSELDITPYDEPHGEPPEGMTRRIPLKGVNRYDGHEFRIFTTANGLAGDTVQDIFQDKAGTLWFATGFGVSRYDGETFNNIMMNGPMGMHVLPEEWNRVKAITQDTAGNFWFGSEAGITYYNLKTSDFRHFGVDPDLLPFQEMAQAGSAKITDLQFDAKENLWMSQDDTDEEYVGIRQYNGKKLTIFPQSEALPMNSVNNIMQDSKGNLWFTGVKKLPPKMHETEDSVSMLFPEIESGVSVYNGKTFQNFNTDNGLPSNRVWSVFEDSRGKLWFATDAGAAVGVYLPSEK
jgi:ligand-binding sensor domain-containing protein